MLSKIKLWHIAAIAFVLLLAYAGIVTERNRILKATVEERDKEVNELTAFATNQKQATSFYINKYRQQVATVKAQEISIANVNRLINTKEFEHLKQMEGLKKDNRNLKASLSYYASLNADSILLNPFTIPCDSNKLKGYKWRVLDDYNDIDVILLDSAKKPKINLPIHVAVMEGKRTKNFIRLFRYGPRSIEVEAVSLNKLFPIDSIDFKVTRK